MPLVVPLIIDDHFKLKYMENGKTKPIEKTEVFD